MLQVDVTLPEFPISLAWCLLHKHEMLTCEWCHNPQNMIDLYCEDTQSQSFAIPSNIQKWFYNNNNILE